MNLLKLSIRVLCCSQSSCGFAQLIVLMRMKWIVCRCLFSFICHEISLNSSWVFFFDGRFQFLLRFWFMIDNYPLWYTKKQSRWNAIVYNFVSSIAWWLLTTWSNVHDKINLVGVGYPLFWFGWMKGGKWCPLLERNQNQMGIQIAFASLNDGVWRKVSGNTVYQIALVF